LCAGLAASLAGHASGKAKVTVADLQKGLDALVAAPGGPPGAIVTLTSRGRMTVVSAGRADAGKDGAPKADDYMRIASVSKAFNAAVALHLVAKGKLGLDDTIGQHLPGLPDAWSKITVRQMLNHTSGLPDYLQSDGIAEQASTNPQGYVSPGKIIDWVRETPLRFAPGSHYAYSNTDNILVGLIAEAIINEPYGSLLQDIVFGPAGLSHTSFPIKEMDLPSPSIHGYAVQPGSPPRDMTRFISPSGAWASGAIVSTPKEMSAFIRADLRLKFFGASEQKQQMQFVPGESGPPGPGTNEAGLGLYRYATPCGVVYGHTGNFPGYVQWVAATRDGTRSVTSTINMSLPTGELLERLREVQAQAVCVLLGK
jgi:D-alanyl-D-alanine carboxypeptidase